MRWDIDKKLSDLLASGAADPSITIANLDRAQWQSQGLSLPKRVDVGQSWIKVWCIALGYSNQDKLVTYGFTIREAYLKARKAIKSLTPEELQAYGLKGPKKKFKKSPKRKDPK